MLRLIAAVLGLAAVASGLGPLVGPAQDSFREPPFVAGTALTLALLGIVSVYAAGGVQLRRKTGEGGPAPGGTPVVELSPPERRLRALLQALAALFAAGAIACGLGALLDSTEGLVGSWPFAAGSALGLAGLAAIGGYAAADLRRNMPLVGPMIAVLAIAAVLELLYLWLADGGYSRPIFGGEVEIGVALGVAAALDALAAVALLVAYRAAWRARYRLDFLRPTEYRALIALADVLVAGEREAVPPHDIAANVEAYVSRVRARRRWVYRVCLTAVQYRPLAALQPPLSEIEPVARRQFLKSRFLEPPPWPRFWKLVTQVTIRVCQQLAFAGYYNDPRAFPSIGYVPFSRRERRHELDLPEPGPHPLKVERPEQIDSDVLEADICIVGSGAGGAILAHELARAGRSVLILERGKYVEPRHFSENEVEMISDLYADGVMQQTEDFRFTVLQGSCVGGSTTVNNAVCFPPPERVLAKWNDPLQHDAGLDADELGRSIEAVEELLRVRPMSDVTLNPSGVKFIEGARALNLSRKGIAGKVGLSADEPLEADVVRANIADCPGSGYCNIGCRWGKKLSMLDTALPWAQRDHPDRVQIVAECAVERVRTQGSNPKCVRELRARLSDGRSLRVKARKYVISAGAVGSSYLLIRSRAARDLPVGRKLSFNMGAPMTAEFEETLNAYDGLQISHFGVPRTNGFVFETWFNPPVAQALNMPGWFEDHFDNMLRYDHLMAVGVLVGTEGNAHVRQALTGGPGIVYRPRQADLHTLAKGLQLLGEILFAAGAKRVMLNTWGYDVFREPRELGRIEQIALDPDYITLGTGHPQGGNAISRDPRRGVVGPDFRVHGYEDLYVCDASVFPSSLTVNPQLTVMGLAHYAASRIAA